jgi:ketosteroid isomerase-like protein
MSAEFLTRFERAWRSRDPQALEALLHPDVVLVQPLLPLLSGRARAGQALAAFLALFPDLEIVIGHAHVDDAGAFIEFSFRGTVGRRPVTLNMVDRIELDAGLIRKRICYFDPAAAAVAAPVERPSHGPIGLRSGVDASDAAAAAAAAAASSVAAGF